MDDPHRLLARLLGLPFANLSRGEIKKDMIALVPEEVARKHGVIPIIMREGVLVLATANPRDPELGELRSLLGRDVALAVAEPDAIADALNRYYGL